MKIVLLAGQSSAGKTTLARALVATGHRQHISTSDFLRSLTSDNSPAGLFVAGEMLDRSSPGWLRELAERPSRDSVIDAVRSRTQDLQFGGQVVRVNVRASYGDIDERARMRNRPGPVPAVVPYQFANPDFVWDSSRVSLGTAVSAVNQLCGSGVADILVGGQYGSEGKGKLADLLAHRYHYLVRSGGPNAGHTVRARNYEHCFHHLPSGALGNPQAGLLIAAGATLDLAGFMEEVLSVGVAERTWVDPNAVLISDDDRTLERELVGEVGSTAQGVGSATARRVWRRGVRTADREPLLRDLVRAGVRVSELVSTALSAGNRVMLEGTQGSALSIWHGPYPFTTSRDTNASGLAAEVGVPPSQVGDVWMVLRTFPIRVGGNSGPLAGEITWEDVAEQAALDPKLLRSNELTSTTKRQRRVARFNWPEVVRAVQLNRPTRLFLTMADYLSPHAAHRTNWAELPDEVLSFCVKLEEVTGVPVAGVSTGRNRDDVAWRFQI